MGISHSLSLLLQQPLKTILFFLMTFKSVFVKTMSQLSSHSCPNEIREELCRLSKTAVRRAVVEKCCDGRGRKPEEVDVMVELSDNVTVGSMVSQTSVRISTSVDFQ